MPREQGFYTVAEAAAALGIKEVSVRSAIRDGRLTAARMGARLLTIAPDELDRYRLTHLGGQGWDKRKDPDYQPSKMAQWARDYRRRKAGSAPPTSPEPPNPTG
jgi:excisionase family DNA binding protein